MDKTTLGILGAVSALTALPAAGQAAPAEPAVAPAQSFAELLQPIPNAVERLKASDVELAGRPRLIEAQYVAHHHHHHHHHNWWWRRHRHHHHHHHH
jgi:hypothetical protein